MRTIHTTGGYGGVLVGDLQDEERGLLAVAIKGALVPEGTWSPPVPGSASWKTVTVQAEAPGAEAEVSLEVDNTTTQGHYHLALKVTVDGREELVWAMDSREPTKRALVRVT